MTSRARWSDDEWNRVCYELYRRTPVAAMTNVDLIKKSDVIEAMESAIDKPRWHRTMNMTVIRPKLRERFDNLKEDLQRLEREQKEERERIDAAERAQAKSRSRVDVFAPMIDVIADRLFDRLKPMMESYIDARLNGKTSPQAHSEAITVHQPRASKIKLGVVGLIPIQEQEVKKRFSEFPFVEMYFYDKEKSMRGFKEWATSLDHVFTLPAKSGHEVETALRQIKDYSFTRVAGRGTSAMIRGIEVWLASTQATVEKYGAKVAVSR